MSDLLRDSMKDKNPNENICFQSRNKEALNLHFLKSHQLPSLYLKNNNND